MSQTPVSNCVHPSILPSTYLKNYLWNMENIRRKVIYAYRNIVSNNENKPSLGIIYYKSRPRLKRQRQRTSLYRRIQAA